MDSSATHAAANGNLFDLNNWRGRTKIRIVLAKFISACIINPGIYFPCIPLLLCSISWTKLWWDHKLTSVLGRQVMVDDRRGVVNDCPVDFINQ